MFGPLAPAADLAAFGQLNTPQNPLAEVWFVFAVEKWFSTFRGTL